MWLVLLCVSYVVYVVWDKVFRIPDDAPPKLSYIESLKLYLNKSDLWTKFTNIVDMNRESGGVGYGNLGLMTIYAVSDPEDSMTVLKASSEKGFIYELWKPWMGNNSIFTANAKINKEFRKLFLPLMTPRKLDAFVVNMDCHAKMFVNKMADKADGAPFDILRDLLIYNLGLFSSTLFDLPDVYKVYDFNPYCDAMQEALRIAIKKFMNPLYQINTIFGWSELKKTEDKSNKLIHDTSAYLIERRKHEKAKVDGDDLQEANSYIDILLDAVNKGLLTEKQMIDEVSTIIFGGHDTTAFTTLFTLVCLGSSPEVQEKVHKEILEVLGDNKNVDIRKEHLSKMVYLEASIRESMRLYPYGVILGRQLDRDIKLKTCTFRKDANVFILTWGVNRHPSWGPDALEYRPERWLDDTLPRPANHLSFSEGPRACAGRRYAMLSMKTLLAHLLLNYKLHAEDHAQMKFEMLGVLEPIAGHHISLQMRA